MIFRWTGDRPFRSTGKGSLSATSRRRSRLSQAIDGVWNFIRSRVFGLQGSQTCRHAVQKEVVSLMRPYLKRRQARSVPVKHRRYEVAAARHPHHASLFRVL